jgi:hypothetical protein
MEVHRILGLGFPSTGSGQAWSLCTKRPWRDADKETRGWEDREQGEASPCHLVATSPCHLLALTEGDEAQLLNYLKGTGYRVGLLLNFGAPSLEHKRRVL